MVPPFSALPLWALLLICLLRLMAPSIDGSSTPRQLGDGVQIGANLVADRRRLSTKGKLRRGRLRFVSHNCRGLKRDEDIEEMFSKLSEERIFAACLQETWRVGIEDLERPPHGRVFFAGKAKQTGRGSSGVGIALSPKGCQAYKDAGSQKFDDFGPGIIAIRLLVKDDNGDELGIFLLSVYRHSDWNWRDFQATFDKVISKKRPSDILLVGADCNAKLGVRDVHEPKVNSPCGPFGNRTCNDAGKEMKKVVMMQSMVSAATFFRRPPRGHGTWVHPRDDTLSQIDHFFVGRHDLRRVTQCKRWSRLMVDSDHAALILVLRVNVKFKRRVPSTRVVLARKCYAGLMGCGKVADKVKAEFGQRVADRVSTDEGEDSNHRKLMRALSAEIAELPDKGKPAPPWFDAARSELGPLVAARDKAVDRYMAAPVDQRLMLKGVLRRVRKRLRTAVNAAKSAWIEQHCATISKGVAGAFDCGKEVWNAIERLMIGTLYPSNVPWSNPIK